MRWPVARSVDRRAQLDQVDHLGDRHGLVLVAKSALWSYVPSSVAQRIDGPHHSQPVRPALFDIRQLKDSSRRSRVRDRPGALM
jgi:hypothetical protein